MQSSFKGSVCLAGAISLALTSGCKPNQQKRDPNWTFEVDEKAWNAGEAQYTTGLSASAASEMEGIPEETVFAITTAAASNDWLKGQDGLDFRKFGLSPVGDQKGCGTCWLFSGISALQDQMSLLQGTNPTDHRNLFSHRYILDCTLIGENRCAGGAPPHTWNVYRNEGGFVRDRDYPYSSASYPSPSKARPMRPCDLDAQKYPIQASPGQIINVRTTGPDIPANPETIKALLLAYGPVITSVYATIDSFYYYKSGIYNSCQSKGGNHAVEIVGWSESGKYWIIRNSWGEKWGEKGYARIAWGCSGIGSKIQSSGLQSNGVLLNPILYAGQELAPGESLQRNETNPECRMKLVNQLDGNLVVRQGKKIIWNSKTSGKGPAKLSLTADNLKLVKIKTNEVIWSAVPNGFGQSGYADFLSIESDGSLLIRNTTMKLPIFRTAAAGRCSAEPEPVPMEPLTCTSSPRRWSKAIIQEAFGRPASATEEYTYGNLLSKKSKTLAQLANDLFQNDIHYSKVIRATYLKYLGRLPADSEVANWLPHLRVGRGSDWLIGQFMQSKEYFNRGGGTNQGWVKFLFRDVLGREGDPAGVTAWTNGLNQGRSRFSIAMGFLTSDEYRRAFIIKPTYYTLVGRLPDENTTNAWLNQMKKGVTREVLRAGIAALPESYAFKANCPSEPLFVKSAVGESHTCLLENNGSVTCMGAHDHGQLGEMLDPTESDFKKVSVPLKIPGKDIAAGGNQSCAILNDSSVACWGQNDRGQLGNNSNVDSPAPVTVLGPELKPLTDITGISVGQQHACATTGSKTYCWGDNRVGQLGDGTTTTSNVAVQVINLTESVTAVTAGFRQNCVLLADTMIKCWGQGASNELGTNTKLNLKYPEIPVQTSEGTILKGATKIVAKGGSFCAKLENQTLRCWGSYAPNITSPNAVPINLADVSDVGSNGSAYYVGTNAGLYAWGGNATGQLGIGYEDQAKRVEPVLVDSLKGQIISAISTGPLGDHVCVVSNSQLKCWGFNYYSQLGANQVSFFLAIPTAISFVSFGAGL